MGIKGSPNGEIVFEDMDVPVESLIGEEGEGFVYAMKTLYTSRPVIAAQLVGLAQGSLDAAIQYAKERVQFGRAISKFQGINWMMEDMAARIESARAMTYQAADMVDQEDSLKTYMLACSKLVEPEVAMRAVMDSL